MKLAVIIGSTRPNRMTPRQAKWTINAAESMDGVDTELIDIKNYPMPFFDEPKSPRYNPDREIDPIGKKWLKKLEQFDAYVFITPEYNHSIPGVLKNALDYVTWEIQRKPVSVVSHGAAGGARAATDLKEIISESKAVPLPSYTPLTMVGMSNLIDEDGELTEEGQVKADYLNGALSDMLSELKWYSDALSAARTKD